jgi:hypothetical protein
MGEEETIKDIITRQIEFARRDKCTNADAANRIIVELERHGYSIQKAAGHG